MGTGDWGKLRFLLPASSSLLPNPVPRCLFPDPSIMQFKLEEITQWLEESAADFMLSRSEKRVFKNTLHGRFFTAREIAFINSEVKRIALEKLTDHNAEDLIHWMYDCQKVLLNYEGENKDVELAEAFFSPGRDCLGEIITCIRKAIRSIDVCVFTKESSVSSRKAAFFWTNLGSTLFSFSERT